MTSTPAPLLELDVSVTNIEVAKLQMQRYHSPYAACTAVIGITGALCTADLMQSSEDGVGPVRKLRNSAAVVGHLDELRGAHPGDGDQGRYHEAAHHLMEVDASQHPHKKLITLSLHRLGCDRNPFPSVFR